MGKNTSGLKRGSPGRPRGTLNRVTIEVKALARNLLDDPAYMRKLKQDLRKRRVQPQMESTLWAYAFGKPTERVEVGRVGDFSRMTDDELVAALDTLTELRPEQHVEREKQLLVFSSDRTTS